MAFRFKVKAKKVVEAELSGLKRAELNIFVKDKKLHENPERCETKAELIDHLLNKYSLRQLRFHLGIPTWWDKYHVHFYGIAGVVGVVLTIWGIWLAFFPPTETSSEKINLETSGNQSPAIHSGGKVEISYDDLLLEKNLSDSSINGRDSLILQKNSNDTALNIQTKGDQSPAIKSDQDVHVKYNKDKKDESKYQ